MSSRPNALIIGPMKAGTTWIQDYMEARGDVDLPRGVKETFFFDRCWHKGIRWYQRFFRDAGHSDSGLILEVGASYFHHPEVPQRVYNTLGDVPLVVTLRDPVKRAWSHYLHLRRYGYTRKPLQEAVDDFPAILEASRYEHCLERWYAFFPRENIHCVWQDLLSESPDAYARAVCEALQLDFAPVPDSLHRPSNEASIPQSHRVAALGRNLSRLLKSMGLYHLVNLARRLGARNLFFGRPGSARDWKPTQEEQDWLNARLAPETHDAHKVPK